MDICSVAVPLIVLLEAGKHLVLLKFRVLGRLYSVVPEALSVGDAMAELGSSRRLSCLELCILSTLKKLRLLYLSLPHQLTHLSHTFPVPSPQTSLLHNASSYVPLSLPLYAVEWG